MTTLATLLADWLPRQRWYSDQGPLRTVEAERVATLRRGEPRLDLYVVSAHDDRYQVPLSFRAEPAEGLAHALVGETGGAYVYDATQDIDVNGTWLRLIAERATVDGVTFDGEIGDAEMPARPVGAEQSNTSLVYGDAYILKVYRRLTAAPNPDLEVVRALTDVGSATVPPARGWVEGAGSTLALLQPYLKGGTDGWALALTSIRDLYAERDLHAEEVGGDFAPEAARLGGVTAQLHADLARALPSRLATLDEKAAMVEQLRSRLVAMAETAPVLREHAPAIGAVYAALAATGDMTVQRIHGDYHLGQTLRTGDGWFVLDFEGEPARPLAERTALMSPLRDVAGMLRSFDYAARHQLTGHSETDQLMYRAVEWAGRNRAAFCEGYAAEAGYDPRESAGLLRAFELDKAVYEVGYELAHRPSWVSVPLAGIARLTG